jgi:predicted methyltransferase
MKPQHFPRWIVAVTAAALGACATSATENAPPAASATKATASTPLQTVLAGDWRSAESKARDAARRPYESLSFWGLKPGMTVLEVQPGDASWWTEILSPYARLTGGAFYATGADLANAALSEAARKSRSAFETKYADSATYGQLNVVNWGPKSAPLPPNKFDWVLVARSFHGWMGQGTVEKYLADLHAAIKPGGVLAIEQHRANPGEQDPKAPIGYVTESYLIAAVEKAGFRLAARSELNANAKDTKDHPFGVWTLPPTRRTSPFGKPDDPAFDRSKYDAIGESDRMTLKFVKTG